MITVKTGEVCPRSGQYRIMGLPYAEITLSRGDRVPPYGGRAQTFYLVDATRHVRR